MPKEVMRIIVKNYYKNRKPEKMITWWWREARQVTDRQPNSSTFEDPRATGVSMPTRLPANSRMTKSKKAFSRTRFANLIRRNSIQLKTKGKVTILVSVRYSNT